MKIAALKLHREQNQGLGLAEAKKEVEDFVVQRMPGLAWLFSSLAAQPR